MSPKTTPSAASVRPENRCVPPFSALSRLSMFSGVAMDCVITDHSESRANAMRGARKNAVNVSIVMQDYNVTGGTAALARILCCDRHRCHLHSVECGVV